MLTLKGIKRPCDGSTNFGEQRFRFNGFFQKVDRAVPHGMYGGADVAMGAQKNDRQQWFASQKQCALNFQA